MYAIRSYYAPVAGLLGQLGVSHSNGVIREQRDVLHEQPLDFWVSSYNFV